MMNAKGFPHESSKCWPRAIIGFFVCFISGLAAFGVWGLRQRVDLVRADYYEAEIQHQSQLDRLSRAQAESKVQVVFIQKESVVELRFEASDRSPAGFKGHVLFYRPDDARLDRTVPFELSRGQALKYPVRGMKSGLWKVHLEWTHGGLEYASTQSLVIPLLEP